MEFVLDMNALSDRLTKWSRIEKLMNYAKEIMICLRIIALEIETQLRRISILCAIWNTCVLQIIHFYRACL